MAHHRMAAAAAAAAALLALALLLVSSGGARAQQTALQSGAAAAAAASGVDFPTNFTVGLLYVYDIRIQSQSSPTLYVFTAAARIAVPDAGPDALLFNVTGELGVAPFVVAFSGRQVGTWSPFPTKDLQLAFLALTYNSTTQSGGVSGGDTVFGAWTVEVDLDFVHWTSPAVGFVVTSAKPSLNDMPGAPAHAFDAASSLLNVGLVVSAYDGTFTFTSGVSIAVHTGVNMFAASVLDGVTITYHGMVHFAGGFSVTLTAEADQFELGDGVAVSAATVTAQYPAQPFLAMSVQATWAGLGFTLQGALSTSDIQFTGNAPGPWTIRHGATPVVVSNMLITFDHQYAPGSTTGELRGSVQYGSLPEVTGIMKYPADSQALGCFSLTVIIGDPSSAMSLDGLVQQAVGSANASASYPADAHELFGTDLESITLSVYPDCGALYIDAVLGTQKFGTVNMAFAMFEYVPVSTVLRTFAAGLPSDPPVPVSQGASYTVGAKEVLASVANAFDTVQPPILQARAYIENQQIGKSLQVVLGTASAMRQQLLVQLTEHDVQVDALGILQACVTALQPVSWDAPARYDNATWAWMASLSMTGADWPLSEPAGLYLTAASFALASASFQMTVGDSSIMAEVGFNFVVDLDVSKSTLPALDAFKGIDQCVDKAFQVSGYIGNAQTGWFLQGELTDGCIQLGANLQLSATSLRVQSGAPQVSFESVLTLPQTQDMQFEVSATLSASGGTTTVALSGDSQSVYNTHVGAKPLEIDNVNVQLTVSVGASASSFAGTLSGAVTIDDQTEVAASSSFDSSTAALSFSLSIHEDKPVLLFNLLRLLVGDDVFNKIPMPASGKAKLMGVYLVQGSLALATQPPSLSGSLQVLALYEFLVSASLSFAGGHVAFGFSVQRESGLLDPIKLSDILPNITIVDEFRMRAPVIIVADQPTTMTIPGIEFTYNAQTGFNFAAFLALDNTTQRSYALTKWLGSNEVVVLGVIDPAEAHFELSAQAKLANVPILPDLVLTDAGFFIHVDTPTLDVGFDASAQLHLSSAAPSPDNVLTVSTTFDIGTAGASFSASISGHWVSPFGIHGVTLLDGTVKAAIGAGFASLASFDLSGTVQVGNVQGTGTFVADGLLLSSTVLGVQLASVSLEKDILLAICGKVPSNMFADAAMQTVQFSINPTLRTVQSFPPGVAVAATGFTIGSLTLQYVEFAIDPLLGIRIEVDASSSRTPSVSVGANGLIPLNSWQLILDLMLSTDMGVHLHGAVDLLSVQAAADVDIDIHDFKVAFNFTCAELSVVLTGDVASGGNPFGVPDLALAGQLDLHGYLSQRLLYYAQQTSDQKAPEMKQIEQKIADLQNDVAELQSEIAARSQNDTAAKQAAEAAVQKAQAAVDDAKSKVNDLNGQIEDAQDKLKQCGKYDYVCQAKYKAEIVSLQAALKIADAALDAANAVLQEALDVLNKLPDPDTDPQILAWKAEVLADQGLIGTLQGALAADQAVTKLASQVLSAGAAALQPTSISFASSSYIAVTKGTAGNTQLVGSFLGKPVTLNVGIVLNQVEQYVSDVWDALQKLASNY